ncbi:hypothetical protein KBC54_01855 [Patescibacteria group bacterium]|nr:hypothetical protein [Patescibacteria group bacterium]
MDKPSKAHILRILAHRVDQTVPLQSANIAVLGGAGLEVDILRGAGVPDSQLWIVERKPKLAGQLMRRYPEVHLVQGSLRTLPRLLRGSVGKDAGIDAFHWDLCGTIEPEIAELTSVLPLLANGTGKHLFITLADQRRNRSLDEEKLTRRICGNIFGDSWLGLWTHLLKVHNLEQHPEHVTSALPENSALREAGSMLHLLLALSSLQTKRGRYMSRTRSFPLSQFLRFRETECRERSLLKQAKAGTTVLVPESLERFVYWSDDSNFRMRTYVIRLKLLNEPIPLLTAAKQFARLIRRAPYSAVDPNQIIPIWPRTAAPIMPTTQHLTEELTMTTDLVKDIPTPELLARLDPVKRMCAILNPALPEYIDELGRRATMTDTGNDTQKTLIAVLEHVQHALDAGLKNGTATEALPAATETETADPVPPSSAGTSRRSARSRPQRLGADTVIEIQLKMLEAWNKGDPASANALEKCKEQIARDLGISRQKNRYRRIGACFARTQGAFRGDFVARVLLSVEPSQHKNQLKKLAKLYPDTTPALLQTEVEASTPWKKHLAQSQP